MKKKIYEMPCLNDARKRTVNKVISKSDFTFPEEYKTIGLNKHYFIITHGCQANQRDSETMAGILEFMGYKAIEDKEKADIILINTCAVRQNAEEKVLGELGDLKRLKKTNPELIIGVGGCMAQEEEAVKIIMDKYPQVDIIFGTHNITNLPKLIKDTIDSNKRIIEVFSKMGDVVESVPVTRFMSHKAWVNIMYGCDKFCTYCIVPYTRGTERSRLLEDIVKECEELKVQGYKEVCLLGQNVNAYGKDLKLGYNFGDLLNAVAKVGIERVRFVTSHPWDFDESMIKAMKENANIMPYLHLPLQSGSTEILKKMNRRYTSEDYKKLVDKIKKELPHYAITTDIIVGFPNETDEDFKATLDMVDYVEYDNAFTFIYSKREGTPAASMLDAVETSVKEARLQELNKKIAYYANKNNQKFLNKEVLVLVDGLSKKNDKVYSGYTPENKLVNFKGENVKIGDIVKVKITEVMSFSLNGIML